MRDMYGTDLTKTDSFGAPTKATVQPPDRGAASLGQLDAHGLAALRTLLFDVLDQREWQINATHNEMEMGATVITEEMTTEGRVRLVDAIIAEVVRRAAPATQAKGGQR